MVFDNVTITYRGATYEIRAWVGLLRCLARRRAEVPAARAMAGDTRGLDGRVDQVREH